MLMQQTSNIPGAAAPALPRAGPATILIVDDDAGMRAALLKVLRKNGFHYLVAADGYEMMTILAGQRVDLVPLDGMMPGISGFDLCRTLRQEQNPVPVIMISISLYYVTRTIGLYGTAAGLALSHALLCLPFVVLNVGVSLKRLDPNLVRAAEGLGAGPWRVFRTVTFPAILPGLAGGATFAFVTSFDEVVISIFIAGYGAKTLPVKLWEQIRVEFTPVAAVASTVILGLTMVLFVLGRRVTMKKAAAAGTERAWR